MSILAALGSVKDWADLLHAVAWPTAVLIICALFKKIIEQTVEDILRRVPLERASLLKIPGVAEMKLGPKPRELATAKEARIPVAPLPIPDRARGTPEENR